MFETIDIPWIDWLIRHIFYRYPEISLLAAGGVTLLLLVLVMRRTFFWLKFARNKRTLSREIQSRLKK